MLSATDTFTSASQDVGNSTDAASGANGYNTDDAGSRFASVARISNQDATDREGSSMLSRSTSNRTAHQDDGFIPERLDPIPAAVSTQAQCSHAACAANTPPASSSTTHSHTQHDASTQEAGAQIEPEPLAARTPNRAMRHLSTLGLLTFASIWGTLAREGLVALNTYSGASVDPLVWAQAVGCLIMGLAIGANRSAIQRRYPPAYVMITTGFCGSVTTFSKWMLDIFRAFGDQAHYNRHGLHNVMDALSRTAVTFGMALISIAAGVALSNVVNLELLLSIISRPRSESHRLAQGTQAYSPHKERRSNGGAGQQTLLLDAAMAFVGLAFWIASAILCALYAPFRRVTFSLVLAPPGTMLRWYLSRLNTTSFSQRTSLPVGTLAANLLATAVISGAFTASRAGSTPRSFAGALTGCQALQALQDGFCGCLSTVSTLAVELRSIKPTTKAVRYAVVSWTAGVLLCVLLVGAPWWTLGMDGRCLGYTT